MKTILFFVMCTAVVAFTLWRLRRPPSRNYGQVDVIVPAFNEEPCLEQTLRNLHANKYVHRVICVNDGSTDGTGAALDRWARIARKLVVVHQANSGKGGAVMNGLRHVTTPYVFLTDADTYVPATGDGLGHMIAELDAGAHAVGGVPSSDLRGLGLLGYIRATVKLPMIVLKRTFQQMLGGAPFIISGACGMFRTDVLREVGLSDRTKVEDLDLTWELVGRGSLLNGAGTLLASWAERFEVKVFSVDMGFLLAMLPPGAFISLGLLIAVRNWLARRATDS